MYAGEWNTDFPNLFPWIQTFELDGEVMKEGERRKEERRKENKREKGRKKENDVPHRSKKIDFSTSLLC